MSGEFTPLRTPRAPGADKKLARLMRGTFLVAVALGVADMAPRRGLVRHARFSAASAPAAAVAGASPASAAAVVVSDLAIDCDTPTAIFVCLARFNVASAAAATVEVSVAHHRVTEDGLAPLWSPKKTIALPGAGAALAVSTSIFRLTPSARYVARVFVRDASSPSAGAAVVAARATFSPPATGAHSIDAAGGFVNVSGAPSWDVLYVVAMRDGWDGLVAIDSTGSVVWGYETRLACVFSQDASFRIGLMSTKPEYGRGAKNSCLGSHANYTDLATGARGQRSTRLSLLHPTGELVATTALQCFGAATGYEEYTHELFADGGGGGSGSGALATIRISVQTLESPLVINKAPSSYVFDEALVRWDPLSRSVETLVDFSRFLSPDTTRVYRMAGDAVRAQCGDDAPVLDVSLWMHASSVARSADGGEWIVSFVGLAAVAGFSEDGSTLNWIASCSTGLAESPELNYLRPESDDACFGFPHAVVSIDATHVLFIDDGDMRAGSRCTSIQEGTSGKLVGVHCFSRALMIEIDLDAGTFGVAWQFSASGGGRGASDSGDLASAAAGDDGGDDYRADEDLYNMDGGSVVPLENGHYLITFGNVRPSTGAMERGVYTRVFEVDKAGSVHSEARVPQNAISDNTYRTLPKASVGGETREPPFALGES